MFRWLFSRYRQDPAESSQGQIDALATRVRRIEELDGERHLLTLQAYDKILHRLRDRTEKREQRTPGNPQSGEEAGEPGGARPMNPLLEQRRRKLGY